MAISLPFGKNLTKPRKVVGLSVFFAQEGGEQWSYVRLAKKGSSLELGENGHDLPFDDLPFTAQDPIHLHLDGRGVLSKVIETKKGESYDDRQVLAMLLPNAKVEEFYVQWQQTATGILASAVRQTLVQEWVARFEKKKWAVVSLSLGPGPLVGLQLAVNHDTSLPFRAGNYAFDFGQELVRDFQKSSDAFSLTIGTDEIEGETVPAYAAAFGALAPLPQVSIQNEEWSFRAEEFEQARIFRYGGFTALGIIFVVVLVNYLVFMSQQQKKSDLSVQARFKLDLVEQRDSLFSQTQEKEVFMKEAGWLSGSKLSYFGDRIASGVPKTIQLKRMDLHPLDATVLQKEKRLAFQSNMIVVEGACRDMTQVNPWISQLKGTEWISEVHMSSYQRNDHDRVWEFQIQITL